MIETLITLLILAVIVYVVVLVLGMIPLPDIAKKIAYIIIGLIALVKILEVFGYSTGSLRL